VTIDEHGFLDGDAASWIIKHRTDNKEIFAVCEKINRLAQTHLHKLNIHSEDVQELLVSLLFIRALATYQTSILLIERGLVFEAKIILRCLIEILFKLRAVSNDRDVAVTYVYEDEVFRKKFINKFKLLSSDVKEAQGNPQLDDLLATIKENIQNKNIQEQKTQWYAHKAGLDDYYNTVYALFSGSVHANVRELQELLKTDETGRVTEILYGPDIPSDLHKLLLTGGESLCLILQDVSRVFGLKLDEHLSELHEVLKRLVIDRENKEK
jgi:Family of unknown function (DUF5677)